MKLTGYFIDVDAFGDAHLWRGTRDDFAPQPVIGRYSLRDDPAVWALLEEAVA